MDGGDRQTDRKQTYRHSGSNHKLELTVLVVFISGNKVVRSFSRGCEEQLGRVAGCIQDAYFITCSTYCTGQYCNDGDGIPASRAIKSVYRP